MLTTAGFRRAAMSAKLIEEGLPDAGGGTSAIGAGATTADSPAASAGAGDAGTTLGEETSTPTNTPMIAHSAAVVITKMRAITRPL
jgi:hypothetical protein